MRAKGVSRSSKVCHQDSERKLDPIDSSPSLAANDDCSKQIDDLTRNSLEESLFENRFVVGHLHAERKCPSAINGTVR